MVKRIILLSVVFIIVAVVTLSLAADNQPAPKNDKIQIRVGTFDSRAVAVAYANSDFNSQRLKSKMSEMKKAKAAGDTKKIEELEAWGQAQQNKLHKQGFGTAPVHDLLENIKADIPEIARKTGIDIIVSKWEVVYQNPSIELIDITDEIIKPFKPSEKTLKSIKSLLKQTPVSKEVLVKMNGE